MARVESPPTPGGDDPSASATDTSKTSDQVKAASADDPAVADASGDQLIGNGASDALDFLDSDFLEDAVRGAEAPAPTPGSNATIVASLDARSGDDLHLSDLSFMYEATYVRQGSDLLLVKSDGTAVLVENYFAIDPPPDIVGEMGRRLSPELVDSFLMPMAPGQSASLTGEQVAQAQGESIGSVDTLTGEVYVIRPDGTRVLLQAGDPVFQGDQVETTDGGSLKISFVDGTIFTLGSDARLALDEMVYDPGTQSGQSAFSILKGGFLFVSGQIAENNPNDMQVTTPVATIGIRGTIVTGEVAGLQTAGGETFRFTVVDGEIAVSAGSQTIVLSDNFSTVSATPDPATGQLRVFDFVDTAENVIARNSNQFKALTSNDLSNIERAIETSIQNKTGAQVDIDLRGIVDNVTREQEDDQESGDNEPEDIQEDTLDGGTEEGAAPDDGTGDGEETASGEDEITEEDLENLEEGEETAEETEEEVVDEAGVEEGESDEIEDTDVTEGGPAGEQGPGNSEQTEKGKEEENNGDLLSKTPGFGGNNAYTQGEPEDDGEFGAINGDDGTTGSESTGNNTSDFTEDKPKDEDDTEEEIGTGDDDDDVVDSVINLGEAALDATNTIDFNTSTASFNINLSASTANVTVKTGSGNDIIKTGSGNDTVNAGAGNDQIVGGTGNGDDSYDGGSGTDTLTYDSVSGTLTAGLTMTMNGLSGTSTINDGGASVIDDDAVTGIEEIRLGDGNDIIYVNTLGVNVDGDVGTDTLSFADGTLDATFSFVDGVAGLDNGSSVFTNLEAVEGGDGNDAFTLSNLNQSASGGGGTDTLSFAGLSEGQILTLGSTGIDVGETENFGPAQNRNTDYTGFEKLVGTNFADDITANNGQVKIDGGGGADTLTIDPSGSTMTVSIGTNGDIQNVETIDLSRFNASTGTTITIDVSPTDIAAATSSGTLHILGADDPAYNVIRPGSGWTRQEGVSAAGDVTLTSDSATLILDATAVAGASNGTVTFTGAEDNSWQTSANWSNEFTDDLTPISTDRVELKNDNSSPITFNGAAVTVAAIIGTAENGTTDSLLIQSGTLTVSDSISITDSIKMTNATKIILGGNGSVGTLDTNGGHIEISDGIISTGRLEFDESNEGTAQISGNGTLVASDSIVFANGYDGSISAVLDARDADFSTASGQSELDILSGGTLLIDGDTTYSGASVGSLTVDVNSGGILEIGPDGTVSLNDGTAEFEFFNDSTILLNGVWTNSGTFTAFESSTQTNVDGSGTLVNTGTVYFFEDDFGATLQNSDGEVSGTVQIATGSDWTLDGELIGGAVTIGYGSGLMGTGSATDINQLYANSYSVIDLADLSVSGFATIFRSTLTGNMDMSEGTFDVRSTLDVKNDGVLTIGDDSSLSESMFGSIQVGSGGTVAVAEGETVNLAIFQGFGEGGAALQFGDGSHLTLNGNATVGEGQIFTGFSSNDTSRIGGDGTLSNSGTITFSEDNVLAAVENTATGHLLVEGTVTAFSGGLTNAGTVVVQEGSALSSSANFTNSGTLDLYGTVTGVGTLTNTGVIYSDGGELAGFVDNLGRFTGSGTVTGVFDTTDGEIELYESYLVVDSAGTLIVGDDTQLSGGFGAIAINSLGVVQVAEGETYAIPGSQFEEQGEGEIASSSLLFAGGSVLRLDGDATTSGTVSAFASDGTLGGVTTITGSGTLSNSGRLNFDNDIIDARLENTGRVVFDGNAQIKGLVVNSGNVDLRDGGTIDISGEFQNAGSFILDDGQVEGTGVVTNSGTVDVVGDATLYAFNLDSTDGDIEFSSNKELLAALGSTVTVGADTTIDGSGTLILSTSSQLRLAEGESFQFGTGGAGNSTLEIGNGTSITGTGTLLNQSEIIFDGGQLASGARLENQSSLEVGSSGAVIDGILVNDGTLSSSGEITIGSVGSLDNNSSISVSSSGGLKIDGDASNEGSITFASGADLTGSGTIANAGHISMGAGGNVAVGLLQNTGTLDFSDDNVSITGGTVDATNGTFEADDSDDLLSVTAGGTVRVGNSTEFGSYGTISISTGGTLSIADGESFTYTELEASQGADRQINETDAGDQATPDIARLTNGNYVAVWEQDGNDIGAIFDASGNLVTEFAATDGASALQTPRVAALGNGQFIVGYNQETASFSIMKYGIYNSDGSLAGSFHELLNTPSDSWVDFDVVAVGSGGYGYITRGETDSSFSMRFHGSGNTSSVITTSFSGDIVSGVEAEQLSNGNVAFVYGVENGGTTKIELVTVDPTTGSTTGPTTIASNPSVTGQADIAALADGTSVVVYGFGDEVFGRLVNASGASSGAAFQISQNADNAGNPSVVALSDGGFQVLYEADGTGTDIYSRTFDSSGTATGDETLIAANTTGNQSSVVATGIASGDGAAFLYISPGSDGDDVFFGHTGDDGQGLVLTLGSGATIEGPGTYLVTDSQTLDGITIGAGGNLENDGIITLGANGLTIEGNFDNADGTLTVASDAVITLNSGGTTTLDGSIALNGGVEFAGSSTLDVLEITGQLSSNGGSENHDTISANLVVSESGTIIVGGSASEDGSLVITGDFVNNGFVQVDPNANVNGVLLLDDDFTNTGTLQVDNAATLVVGDDGTIDGTGTIVNTGTISGFGADNSEDGVIRAGSIQNIGTIKLPSSEVFGASRLKVENSHIDSTSGALSLAFGAVLTLAQTTLALANGTTYDNDEGTVVVGTGSVLDLGDNHTVVTDNDSQIQFELGSTVGGTGTLENLGSLDLGGVVIDSTLSNTAVQEIFGTVAVGAGEILTVHGRLDNASSAVLDVDHGTLSGTGTVSHAGTFTTNGATIDDDLTFEGALRINGIGTALTIDGTARGDLIVDASTATLIDGDGAFEVTGGEITGSGLRLSSGVDILQTGILTFGSTGGRISVIDSDWVFGQGAGFTDSNGTLTINGGARLGVAENVDFQYDSTAMARLQLAAGGSAELFGDGTFTNAGGTLLLDGDALTVSVADFQNDATVTVYDSDVTLTSPLVTNSGVFNIQASGVTLSAAGAFRNTGTIALDSGDGFGELDVDGVLQNTGTIAFDNSTSANFSFDLEGSGTVVNAGRIEFDNSGEGLGEHTLNIDVTNTGAISVNANARYGSGESATVTLDSTDGAIAIADGATFDIRSTLAVGNDTVLSGDGTLELGSGSTIDVAAGETFAISDGSQTTGPASVDSPVTVSTDNASEPRVIVLNDGSILTVTFNTSGSADYFDLSKYNPATGVETNAISILESGGQEISHFAVAEMSDGVIRVSYDWEVAGNHHVLTSSFSSSLSGLGGATSSTTANGFDDVEIVGLADGGYAIVTQNITNESIDIDFYNSSNTNTGSASYSSSIMDGGLDVDAFSNGDIVVYFAETSGSVINRKVLFVDADTQATTLGHIGGTVSDSNIPKAIAVLSDTTYVDASISSGLGGAQVFIRTIPGESGSTITIPDFDSEDFAESIDVASTGDGGFVVAWSVTNGTDVDVYLQKYTSEGVAEGDRINTTIAGDGTTTVGATGDQTNVSVAMFNGTDFVVTYESGSGTVKYSTGSFGETTSTDRPAVTFGSEVTLDGGGVLDNQISTEISTLFVTSSATLTNTGTLTVDSSGTINLSGELNNSGLLEANGGVLEFQNGSQVSNTGTIALVGSSSNSAILYGSLDITNAGYIILDDDGTGFGANIYMSGEDTPTLTNSGTIRVSNTGSSNDSRSIDGNLINTGVIDINESLDLGNAEGQTHTYDSIDGTLDIASGETLNVYGTLQLGTDTDLIGDGTLQISNGNLNIGAGNAEPDEWVHRTDGQQ